MKPTSGTALCLFPGNRSLVRVLPQLYAHARDAVAQRVPDLLRLLPACEAPERACVLQLLTMIAKDRPNVSSLDKGLWVLQAEFV